MRFFIDFEKQVGFRHPNGGIKGFFLESVTEKDFSFFKSAKAKGSHVLKKNGALAEIEKPSDAHVFNSELGEFVISSDRIDNLRADLKIKIQEKKELKKNGAFCVSLTDAKGRVLDFFPTARDFKYPYEKPGFDMVDENQNSIHYKTHQIHGRLNVWVRASNDLNAVATAINTINARLIDLGQREKEQDEVAGYKLAVAGVQYNDSTITTGAHIAYLDRFNRDLIVHFQNELYFFLQNNESYAASLIARLDKCENQTQIDDVNKDLDNLKNYNGDGVGWMPSISPSDNHNDTGLTLIDGLPPKAAALPGISLRVAGVGVPTGSFAKAVRK